MNSNQMPVTGGLAVVFAVIISFFVIDPGALEGIRPVSDNREISQVHGIEDVQARLWQDPFAAAAMHKHDQDDIQQFKLAGKVMIPSLGQSAPTDVRIDLGPVVSTKQEKAKRQAHSFESLGEHFFQKVKGSSMKVDVLGVMVSGGPNPEDHETRLRRRYAVIAGMAASGYQPVDAAHIGYLRKIPDSICGGGELNAGKMPAIMPIEWFKTDEGKYAILLWLDEDALAGHPLCKIGHLQKELSSMLRAEDYIPKVAEGLLSSLKEREGRKASDMETNEAYNKAKEFLSPSIDIIGPFGSGTLRQMLRDMEVPGNQLAAEHYNLSDVAFFSATATANAQTLMPREMPEKRRDGNDSVARKFIENGIIFFRTIADDRQLTDKLFDEINRRLFDFDKDRENNYQVALISESDTLYARSLPDAFVNSAYDTFHPPRAPYPAPAVKDSVKKEWIWKHFYRFSYLRGIDGKIAREGKKEESASSGSQKDQIKRTVERPEGTSQKDYLRRLASDIALTHQKLKNEGRKGIRAIGVLGSDVYDKLLILHALRQQFPKAIFFTTDLDAALLHREELPWTRNLLVASSFDLKISSYWDIMKLYNKVKDKKETTEKDFLGMWLVATENSIPQNRDVYQTSVFLSTVLAMNETLGETIKKRIRSVYENFEKEYEKGYQEKLEAQLKKEQRKKLRNLLSYEQSRKERDKAEIEGLETALENMNTDKWKDQVDADVYFDVLLALLAEPEKKYNQLVPEAIQEGFHMGFGKNIMPRVYEIGRLGAVDVSVMDVGEGDALRNNPFYPRPVGSISSRSVAILACSVVLFCLLLFLFWRRWVFVSSLSKDMHSWLLDEGTESKLLWVDWIAIAISTAVLIIPIVCYKFRFTLGEQAVALFVGYLVLAISYICLVSYCCHMKLGEGVEEETHAA